MQKKVWTMTKLYHHLSRYSVFSCKRIAVWLGQIFQCSFVIHGVSKTNAQEICTFGNSLGLQSVLFLAIPTKHINLHTITFMVILPDQQERELFIISFRSVNHILCCGMEWHFVVCKWFVRNPGFFHYTWFSVLIWILYPDSVHRLQETMYIGNW